MNDICPPLYKLLQNYDRQSKSTYTAELRDLTSDLRIFRSTAQLQNTFSNLLDEEQLFSASRAHLFLPLKVGTITQFHQQKQN